MRWHAVTKILAGILLSLAVLAGLGYLVLIRTVTAPWLEEKLQQRVTRNTDSLYVVSIDSLFLDIPSGTFQMHRVSLKPTRDVPKNKASLEITFEALEINRFHWLQYFLSRHLHLDRVLLEGLSITLRDGKAPEVKGESAPADSARSLRELMQLIPAALKKVAASAKIDTLSLERAQLLVVGSGSFRIENANIAVRDLDLTGNASWPVTATDFFITIGSVALRPQGGLYRMTASEVRAAVFDSSLSVKTWAWNPLHDEQQFFKKRGYRDLRIAARAEGLQISGLDYTTLLFDRALNARSVQVKSASLDLFTDNRIPQRQPVKPPQYRKFPHEQFQELPLAASLGLLQIKALDFSYREIPEDGPPGGRAALLDFRKSRLEISGLRKGKGKNAAADTARIRLQSRFMNAGDMDIQLLYAMQPGPWSGRYQGKVSGLPGTALNPLTEPLARLGFREKTLIQRLQFDGKIQQNHVKGWVEAEYQNLSINVLRQQKDEKRLLASAIGNLVLLSNNVSQPGKEIRKGVIDMKRDTTKAFPLHLWKPLQNGMMEILLPPPVLQFVKNRQEKAVKQAITPEKTVPKKVAPTSKSQPTPVSKELVSKKKPESGAKKEDSKAKKTAF